MLLAVADPFTVTYSDTIGAGSASQTWTSVDAVSITFNMNDAPNTITSVFSAAALSGNSVTL
ncbi:MAG: hypothetical protein ACI8QT_001982 [Halioglobus sp.]|jgi:hypothetical protein